ncbi:hypothetical protein, partial [Propionibacterium acidifaciens]|uniref:hypothetical protein n=1 Tax=Propionibacterium acidifaciens TaxID=556499 RepID=UPI00360DD80A
MPLGPGPLLRGFGLLGPELLLTGSVLPPLEFGLLGLGRGLLLARLGLGPLGRGLVLPLTRLGLPGLVLTGREVRPFLLGLGLNRLAPCTLALPGLLRTG